MPNPTDNFQTGNASDLYESYLINDTADSSMEVTPTLLSWTETITVFGFKKSTIDPINLGFMLYDAYSNLTPAVFRKIGDPRVGISGAYAIGCSFKMKGGSDDTVNIQQTVKYIKPGDFCEVAYHHYQQTEVRTFAEDNDTGVGPNSNITAIKFDINKVPPDMQELVKRALANTRQDVPIVARINVPCLIRSIQVTQYEEDFADESTPKNICDPPRPCWNKDPIWGFKAGELLYLGKVSSSTGTPIYNRTYNFLVNMYGWHHFYGIYEQQNGRIPYFITPIDPTTVTPDMKSVLQYNGTAAWRMLPSINFRDNLGHLKPPFNVEVPASLPSGDDLLPQQGDFVPMPGSFA